MARPPFLNNTTGSENTAVGTEALQFNTDGNPNTAIGYAALKNNLTAGGNTAVGYDALLFNDFFAHGFPFGCIIMPSAPMRSLVTLTDTATMLLAPTRFSSMLAALQTPPLVITRSGIMTRMQRGLANGNTAVGSTALFNNVDGSDNTAVGNSTGRNVITGFNNTYIGDFVGTLAGDESNTIRIGDLSNGNGAGSLECYIGGIFNNFQPVGGSVVLVTLDRATDKLGWDIGPECSVVAHLLRLVANRAS